MEVMEGSWNFLKSRGKLEFFEVMESQGIFVRF